MIQRAAFPKRRYKANVVVARCWQRVQLKGKPHTNGRVKQRQLRELELHFGLQFAALKLYERVKALQYTN